MQLCWEGYVEISEKPGAETILLNFTPAVCWHPFISCVDQVNAGI